MDLSKSIIDKFCVKIPELIEIKRTFPENFNI